MSDEGGGWKRPESFEGLVEELRSPEGGHRYWAIEGLKGYGQRAVAQLIDVLSGPYEADWYLAARALGELHADEAVEPLTRLFTRAGSIAGRPQEAAGKALKEIGNVDAELLVQALGNPDSIVRQRAAELAGALGVPGAEDQLIAIAPDTRSAIDALAQIRSTKAIPALIGILQSGDHPGMRSGAASALGLIGDPAAADALKVAIGDPSPVVGAASLSALTDITPEIAQAVVLGHLVDPIPELRVAALRCLGTLGRSDDRQQVAELTRDPERKVREAAWATLSSFRDAESVRLLDGLKAEFRDQMLARFESMLTPGEARDSKGFATTEEVPLPVAWEGLSDEEMDIDVGPESDLTFLLEDAAIRLGRPPRHILTVGNLTSRLSGTWALWGVPLDRLTALVFEGDEADELYVLGAWVTAEGDEAFKECFLAVCASWAGLIFGGADDIPQIDPPLSAELLSQGIRTGSEHDKDFGEDLQDRYDLPKSAKATDAADRLIADLGV